MASLRTQISLLLAFSLISLVLFLSTPRPSLSPQNPNPLLNPNANPKLRVLVADLPRSLNYGLLDEYWALSAPDSRINADPDAALRSRVNSERPPRPPYPSNPLIRQYSAEYWLVGDLETPAGERSDLSAAERVGGINDEYDVVLVPFFATLSAEMELGWGKKGGFLKRDEGQNGDFRRQREVVDTVRGSEAWRRSGGRDHVFILTGMSLSHFFGR